MAVLNGPTFGIPSSTDTNAAALDLDPKDINQVNNMMKTIEQQNDMSDEQNDAEF